MGRQAGAEGKLCYVGDLGYLTYVPASQCPYLGNGTLTYTLLY